MLALADSRGLDVQEFLDDLVEFAALGTVADVAPMIDEVVDLYSYVAEEKQITVQTGFPEELYVTADSSRLSQVLANLVDNAIKYFTYDKK